MKTPHYKVWTAVLIIVATLFIGIGSWVTVDSLTDGVEQRAMNELSVSAQSQTVFLAHSVGQQYAPLESMAAYLETLEDPEAAFLAARDQTSALVKANQLCMLGYADLDGNAYSYNGKLIGNIAQRQYFRDAVDLKGSHSIEYSEGTLLTSQPRVIFGVPVVKDGAPVGMLFAGMEPAVFKDAIYSGNFGGSKLTLVTDGSGEIILINGRHTGRFETGNVFDEYFPEAVGKNSSEPDILSDMQASRAGQFSTRDEFVSYMPLGVSDWYVFGIVERSAVAESYAANIRSYRNAALVFGVFFTVFTVLVVAVASHYSRKMDRNREMTRRQYEQFIVTLSEIKSVVYNYNTLTHKLSVSDNFEDILGYPLPDDLVADLIDHAPEHPEIDMEAMVNARNEVERTGKSTQVVLQAYNKAHVLRWFRIIMAPTYGENDCFSGLCGAIIDVTERHDERQRMMMEQNRLNLAISNLAPLVISCDLTNNTFKTVNHRGFTTEVAPNEGCFDELIDIGASTVPEEDRQSFIDAFSREKLLADYQRGERKVELEHRQLGDDGIVRWMRTSVLFVNNPYDDVVYEITFSRDITESKQYQALLQKTFDLTVENMPSFVGKWLFRDGDVILTYANKRYLEFLGTTEEAAFGKSIFSGLFLGAEEAGSDENSKLLEKLYDCQRQKKPVATVNRGRKMNGEPYWLKVQASYFGEEDGGCVYYGTVTDITEQITVQRELTRAVAELKTAYAQMTAVNAYRDLMDYSHSGGMSVRTLPNSGELRFLYASPGLLNACGYSEEEYMTSIVDGHCRLQHPDDLPRVDEVNRQLNSVGDSFALEYRICHKDGHCIWVIEHAMVVAMPNGEKVVACLTVDMSEQKKLEEKLRVSQEEYKIAASLSSHAVLSYDVASRTYEVISNKDKTHNFARAKHDVPEYAISIGAIAPESVKLVRDLFEAINRGEQRGKSVIALCSDAGTKYWMELSYTIIFGDGGKPLTAILVFDDLTAKMQAEALFNISSTFLNYSQNATKLIVIDLTKRTIRYETEGAHGLLSKVAETRNSSDAVKVFINSMVVPEDEAACTAFFSAARFLEVFRNGTVEESFEYRGYTADNTPHWYNAQTRLVEDNYTHDVILYMVLSDIEKQKQAELELMRRAQTDSLTGLLNRESFEAELKMCCNNPENRACGLFNAVVMIDIDNFKNINDTFGHDMGDEAMRQVARRIRESLRGDDIVARFGGDEFIVQLPRMPSMEMLERRCAKICTALNFKLNDCFTVSGSVGIAVCPVDGSDFPTLFKKADLAMYQAKKAGGNRCARYIDNGSFQMVSEKDPPVRDARSKKVFARTFGYFDLLVDGIPLYFTNAREKELLAILVDRNGIALSTQDAVAILWKDQPAGETHSGKYLELAASLENTLAKAGINNIIISDDALLSIDTAKLECDYYRFLRGDEEFRRMYQGAYMTNYTWAAKTAAALDKAK